MAASRIQRWASFLAGFDYEIRYLKGDSNNADAFSRLPLPDTDPVPIEKNFLNYVSDRGIDIDNKTIKSETAKDPILSKVFVAVQPGNFTSLVGENFKPYLRRTSSQPNTESLCGDTELSSNKMSTTSSRKYSFLTFRHR